MLKKVLFVCIKNTSRSPMAEALVRRLGAPDWEAGIEPGSEANPVAVKVMAERGYDLSRHEPRHVRDLLEQFIAQRIVPARHK
jgi:arsenate reductase (thioredoxin)